MVSAEPIISVQDLHVRFGRQYVLRDLSLSVPRGQTLAIIGESGCGKTVLLKTIIGLVQPHQGHVEVHGQRIDRLTERQLAQQRTRFGFVFQNAALFDSMTIEENILFPLRQHQNDHRATHQDAMLSRLAEVGLPTSVLRKYPAELSGGMRKRVGLARALVMQPEILLYDEPTTGLDPIVSDVINELMMRTRDTYDVTSIVVTHDMKTASKVADRIVMLYPLSRLDSHERQIIFDGKSDEVAQSSDRRVSQFVRGEAGDRLMEMRESR
ncbi:MAG: ABC transporter ATP-binding protein [Planctomycetaceae bacterium]|nr:ABC transporter ATP-binding protein [Planctomycetaceae bacterium]MCH2596454.1 ATP-binding cassette domain-containing protein [Pirellulales bacterium]HCK40649.1 ABC transporter ATP-binding protein [Planctomycetaceae bacterium]|tara:strand:- start:53 stop:856 length:804 start_codon:yes stop_codon:yes gene_type:complete